MKLSIIRAVNSAMWHSQRFFQRKSFFLINKKDFFVIQGLNIVFVIGCIFVSGLFRQEFS